jgi:hypothetical protein
MLKSSQPLNILIPVLGSADAGDDKVQVIQLFRIALGE